MLSPDPFHRQDLPCTPLCQPHRWGTLPQIDPFDAHKGHKVWAGDVAQGHSAWLASVRSWVCLPISKNKTKQNQVCFVSSFLVAGVGPLHFYFLFCSRNQTQGLVLTRQALCRELISPAPRLLHLACLSVIKVMLAISKTLSARNHIFSTGNSIVL